MRLFTFTPKNLGWTWDENADFVGKLYVFNWFTGVKAYGSPGIYYVARRTQNLLTLGTPRYMIPYVEETLETLYGNDRFLLVAGKDFTNDTNLGLFFKDSVVLLHLNVYDPDKFQGRQLQVTYDIEALRPNDVQLFYGWEHQQTLPVRNRCKRAILVDITDLQPMSFFLRPVRRELYINSVEVDLY